METLEGFQQNQRIIEDFTVRTLAALPGDFARLAYVASLRDPGSGRYEHAGLSDLYPEGAVQQALAYCHEQLFARTLESPLEQQEWDLRLCLSSWEGDFWEVARAWRDAESYRLLAPQDAPAYLRDLFASNVRVLLDLMIEEVLIPEPAA